MLKDAIVRKAWEVLSPSIEELGCELVEIEYAVEWGRAVLRIYIDKRSGVSLDDCTAVSQALSPVLDAENFIHGAYSLEVSSPGIDRPVRKPTDFERFIGERIKLRAVEPIQGRRNFKGTLTSFHNGLIGINCGGDIHNVHIENLEKANLDR